MMEVTAWRQTVGLRNDPLMQPHSYTYDHRPASPSPSRYSPRTSERCTYEVRPQAPLSPPTSQSSKPSLPSISSLLEFSLGKRKSSESPLNETPKRQMLNHSRSTYADSRRAWQAAAGSLSRPPDPRNMALPPTPPMRPQSCHDLHSPSIPRAHDLQQSPLLAQGFDRYQQHTQDGSRRSLEPTTHANPAHASASPYSATNGTMPNPQITSYFPQVSHTPSQQLPGRPQLATEFSSSSYTHQHPTNTSPSSCSTASSTNSWQSHHLPSHPHPHQHHHYISPASASGISHPPERYVCPTCGKAFSRPSSLRIHCHSHTGEKPFRCPHAGCGKAFSVRSNMKRHERGCHAGVSLSVAGMGHHSPGLGTPVGAHGGAVGLRPGRALQPAQAV